MSKFKVGDKARVLWSNHFPQLAGEVVTITEPLEMIENDLGEVWAGYPTDFYNTLGQQFCPAPEQIAPLSASPQREIDTVVSWSDCAWKPSQVSA